MTYFVTITLAPFYAFTFCNTFKDTSTPNFEKNWPVTTPILVFFLSWKPIEQNTALSMHNSRFVAL